MVQFPKFQTQAMHHVFMFPSIYPPDPRSAH